MESLIELKENSIVTKVTQHRLGLQFFTAKNCDIGRQGNCGRHQNHGCCAWSERRTTSVSTMHWWSFRRFASCCCRESSWSAYGGRLSCNWLPVSQPSCSWKANCSFFPIPLEQHLARLPLQIFPGKARASFLKFFLIFFFASNGAFILIKVQIHLTRVFLQLSTFPHLLEFQLLVNNGYFSTHSKMLFLNPSSMGQGKRILAWMTCA